MRGRRRTITPILPADSGTHEGLAYTVWLPEGKPPSGGILVLHGADSCKESHYDFARAALPLGFGVLTFDQRGHGESTGPMDQRVIDDVATMADLLRGSLPPAGPVVLRGSSMGGYLALAAAPAARAAAVVAICPASGEGLRRGLESRRFNFAADPHSLEPVLAAHNLHTIAPELQIPVLLLHAEGDEQVPVEHSRELARLLVHPASRLVAVPGGHHRSVQHDHDLQALSLRFAKQAINDA
jgi:alpha-beta hydrolase superfamily lysophospholipase